jgi:hypothetical protein
MHQRNISDLFDLKLLEAHVFSEEMFVVSQDWMLIPTAQA